MVTDFCISMSETIQKCIVFDIRMQKGGIGRNLMCRDIESYHPPLEMSALPLEMKMAASPKRHRQSSGEGLQDIPFLGYVKVTPPTHFPPSHRTYPEAPCSLPQRTWE